MISTKNTQAPSTAVRQFLTQKIAPQDLYPTHGQFEDANILREVAIAILTEQVLLCPMKPEEDELVRTAIELLDNPATEEWQWSAMKVCALYQIGSDVADIVCHLISAARTPRIGVAGLRVAGKDVIRLRESRCNGGLDAQNYLRNLFKTVGGDVTVLRSKTIPPDYADWRRSEGIWDGSDY